MLQQLSFSRIVYKLRLGLPIRHGEREVTFWDHYLFILPLVIGTVSDFLTPYLIWQGMVPRAVRWVADAAVAFLHCCGTHTDVCF